MWLTPHWNDTAYGGVATPTLRSWKSMRVCVSLYSGLLFGLRIISERQFSHAGWYLQELRGSRHEDVQMPDGERVWFAPPRRTLIISSASASAIPPTARGRIYPCPRSFRNPCSPVRPWHQVVNPRLRSVYDVNRRDPSHRRCCRYLGSA